MSVANDGSKMGLTYLLADFDGFTPYVKQLSKKQSVTAQSLLKIEEGASGC